VALIHLSPCELGIPASSVTTVGWDAVTTTTTNVPSIDTTTKRTGAGSYRVNSGAGNVAGSIRWVWTPAPATGVTVFGRAYVRVDALPSATLTIVRMAISAGTVLCSVRLTAAGKLQLFNDVGAAQVGSDSAATVATGQWYRIELSCMVNTAAGADDSIAARVDGVDLASASGLTLAAATVVNFDVGWFGSPGANKSIYCDDVLINDSTGASLTSWSGEGKVVALRPVADVSRVGWTDGNAGTANLFDALDNSPPIGETISLTTATSQIERVANNSTDNVVVECASYADAGITAADLITVITSLMSVGQSTTTATSFKGQITLNPAEGTFTTGSAGAALAGAWSAGTGWYKWKGGVVYNPSVTLSTRPRFTITKNTSSNSITQAVSAAAILVNYVEGGAPSTIPPRTQNPRQAVRRAAWY
jgi:hypothetical protein